MTRVDAENINQSKKSDKRLSTNYGNTENNANIYM